LAGIIQKPSELSMIFPLKYQFRSGIWVPPMFDDTFRGDFQPGFFLHSRVDAVKYVKKNGHSGSSCPMERNIALTPHLLWKTFKYSRK
jgi:hypothetical protein